MADLSQHLKNIQGQIAAATSKSGRPADCVQLLAVSKTYPPEIIQHAYAAGQIHFGENRVQELIEKIPALPQDINWHLIGHLQKNKVRKVLAGLAAIHSVDSLPIAQSISRIAGELELKSSIYLQVNISQDGAKFGFTAEEMPAVLEQLQSMPHLHIEGLMTIPEFTSDLEKTRCHFSALRDLRDQLTLSSGLPLPGLSMGMSHDFPVAIEEGATIVRVGSAIFGQR